MLPTNVPTEINAATPTCHHDRPYEASFSVSHSIIKKYRRTMDERQRASHLSTRLLIHRSSFIISHVHERGDRLADDFAGRAFQFEVALPGALPELPEAARARALERERLRQQIHHV